MTLKNTQTEFGLVAKGFHWLIAFIILGLIPVGFFMTGMDNSPVKFEVYAWHKTFGLTVFFLGLARIIWRFISPPPPVLATHQRWEHRLANAAHIWLYICIIGLPLSGWLMSSAAEFPVPFFGLQMPALMGKDEGLADLFQEVHEALAYSILAILALHIAGALKHHVIDRDETLKRMAYRRAGIFLAVTIVFISGLSYVVSAYSMLKEGEEGRETSASSNAETTTSVISSAEPVASAIADGWVIDQAASSLTFTATLYGAKFEGTFKDFSGEIEFDPKNPEQGSGIIRISMKDVVTGDKDRDSNIGGAAFFDSTTYPESVLKIDSFIAKDDGFEGQGTLTIKGVAMPITFPFTLDINDTQAIAVGTLTLKRLDFGIGTGEWVDDKTIGHDVIVSFNVTATRP
jgi:cytochrome b561/polyisoprenoid-binding protein YceI